MTYTVLGLHYLRACLGRRDSPPVRFCDVPDATHELWSLSQQANASKIQQFATKTSCAGGRQNIPPPLQVDFWPFDLESGVRVTCDVGYLCANYSLPKPLCSQLRPDVRDRQTSDRQTSDAHHRLMPPTLGAGHNNPRMIPKATNRKCRLDGDIPY